MSFIYLIKCEMPEGDMFKIGYSRNPDQRLKELKTANPNPLTVVAKFQTKHNRLIETNFHRLYKHKNIDGEWFYLFTHDVDGFIPTCEQMEKNFDVLKKSENPFLHPKANKFDTIWKW